MFTTPINSKCCSICHRLVVIGWSFETPNFWRVRVTIFTNRKLIHDFPIQRFDLSSAVWSEFQCQIMPPPPFWGLEWSQGVENGINRNVIPTFLFIFYTHYRPILHHLATTWHADIAIGIGRLCSRIGGLKNQQIIKGQLTLGFNLLPIHFTLRLYQFSICILHCN